MHNRNAHLYCRQAIATILLLASFLPPATLLAGEDEPDIVGFPFKRGYWAQCSRGTKKGHGWVFDLREGPPVVAAAPGRVFQIEEPLGILVDHGRGRYGAYMINGRWEPEVKPGELLAAGTVLADIDTRGNRKGRGVPILNFSMRGPVHEKTHHVLFRLSGSKKGVNINKKTKYLSGTRKGVASGGAFRDSVLNGNEFRENGILITSGNPMFWVETDKDTVYEGKVIPSNVQAVVFRAWQKNEQGKQTVVYETSVKPNPDKTFKLVTQIPLSVQGPCLYQLAAKPKNKGITGPVRLRAGASPNVGSM